MRTVRYYPPRSRLPDINGTSPGINLRLTSVDPLLQLESVLCRFGEFGTYHSNRQLELGGYRGYDNIDS